MAPWALDGVRSAGAGGGTVFFEDDFDRADANPIDNSWVKQASGSNIGTNVAEVLSNECRISVSQTSIVGDKYVWIERAGTFEANPSVYVEATVRVPERGTLINPSAFLYIFSPTAGLTSMASGSANIAGAHGFVILGGEPYQIRRLYNGSFSATNLTSPSYSQDDYHRLGVYVEDDGGLGKVRWYIDGVVVSSVANALGAFGPGYFQAGIRMNTGGGSTQRVHFDDVFISETVPGGAPGWSAAVLGER